MKLFKFIILFFLLTNFSHAAKMTMKYGGETVNTTMLYKMVTS